MDVARPIAELLHRRPGRSTRRLHRATRLIPGDQGQIHEPSNGPGDALREQPDVILSINGQGLYDGNRELIGGVITFRDVTEQSQRTLQLEKLAQFDELTGLANRRRGLEVLENEMGRVQRGQQAMASGTDG